MARYIERLDEMLNEGTITQEQYDDLAELSAAKEAIKEHNQVKSERDELAQKLRNIERQPVRERVFSELGVDFANLGPAEKQVISGFDWEGEEPDKEKAAEFISTWGLPTKTEPKPEEARPGIEQLTNLGAGSSLQPIGQRSNLDEVIAKARSASTAEQAIQILRDAGVTHVEMPPTP